MLSWFHFSFFNMILFIFGCAGSWMLCGLFSGCSEWRLLLVAVCRLLVVVASLAVEQGCWECRLCST